MPGLVLLELLHRGGAGPHQAHLPLEDVPELGQLVDAGGTDKLAHLGHPGVVLHLEHLALHLVLVHQVRLAVLGIHGHGAELIDIEVAAIFAHPPLAEQGGTFGLQFDGGNHEDAHHCGDEKPHQGPDDIDDPLHQQLVVVEEPGGEADHRHVSQGVDAAAVALFALQHVDVELDGNAHLLEAVNVLLEGLPGVIGHVDVGHIHHLPAGVLHHVLQGGHHGVAPDGHAPHILVHNGDAQGVPLQHLLVLELGEDVGHPALGGHQVHVFLFRHGPALFGHFLDQHVTGVHQHQVAEHRHRPHGTGQVLQLVGGKENQGNDACHKRTDFDHIYQLFIAISAAEVLVGIEKYIHTKVGHQHQPQVGDDPVHGGVHRVRAKLQAHHAAKEECSHQAHGIHQDK